MHPFQDYCVQNNSYLAHIDDSKQNAFLKYLFLHQSKSCVEVLLYIFYSYFLMSVASLYTLCFVMFSVFLYGPFCHGAHKLDLSTLFTTCFL